MMKGNQTDWVKEGARGKVEERILKMVTEGISMEVRIVNTLMTRKEVLPSPHAAMIEKGVAIVIIEKRDR
jgi:hypothetical protein